MTSAKNFDLVVRSTIVRSEKANKGLDTLPAPNPNQMNRIIGYLPDGTKIVIAQRPGKGGMDFNKIMGGKVFAVAADGISPVFEKDKEGKATKTVKQEDGLPLYSSSGFYLMSSKEYPALDMLDAYTKLLNRGEQVALVTAAQLKATDKLVLESELDLEMMGATLLELLADSHNLVARFDADANKKRRRGIDRAKEEAEDAGEPFSGVAFKEVAVSKKDGNPLVVLSYRVVGSAEVQTLQVLREAEMVNEDYDDGRTFTKYFTPEEALDALVQSKPYQQLAQLVDSGKAVEVAMTQGHLMRTSVSFRRKAENVLAAGTDKPLFGDAVYIHGALTNWCRGLVSILHSMHPNFPSADYDAHHYVVAVRQAEVGMSKKADGSGWTPPKVIPVPLGLHQFE